MNPSPTLTLTRTLHPKPLSPTKQALRKVLDTFLQNRNKVEAQLQQELLQVDGGAAFHFVLGLWVRRNRW